MKLAHCLKRATAITAILVATATTAAADSGSKQVTSANPNTLVVVSNGQSYTQMQQDGIVKVHGKFQYDAGTSGRIKQWTVWPEIKYGYGIFSTLAGTKGFEDKGIYGHGSRPKSVNENVTMNVPANAIRAAVVSSCNLMAAALESQGKSKTEIFGKDRETELRISLGHEVEVTGAKGKIVMEASNEYKLKIRCSKFAGASLPTAGTIQAPEKPALGLQAKQAGGTPDPKPALRLRGTN